LESPPAFYYLNLHSFVRLRTDRSGHGKRGSGTLSSVQEGAEP